MKQFKLGFGPMSKEIIEILAQHTKENNYPLMIIASRNQVDYDSGYVCTTKELLDTVAQYRNDNLLVCRDHCGPYFCDADKDLSLADAMVRTKQTIQNDIASGMDLIHIDVSKIPENQLQYATELIDFTLSIKPDMKLEFGSEENTGTNVEDSLSRVNEQLVFLSKYKDNVKFFVTQTGSLTKDNQVGTFNVEQNKQVAAHIKNAGFLFKEHNADYFTEQDLKNRVEAGIDSLNIAPQLGKIQTDLLKELAPIDLWNKFADYVYAQNKWQRWTNGNADKDVAVSVSGHYCYNSDEYKAILSAIDKNAFNAELKNRIDNLLNSYKVFDKDYDAEEAEFQRKLKQRLEELRRRDPFIYR